MIYAFNYAMTRNMVIINTCFTIYNLYSHKTLLGVNHLHSIYFHHTQIQILK